MKYNLTVSGDDMMSTFGKYLEHLLACESLLFDLYDHPSKPLLSGLGEGSRPLTSWESETLAAAVRWVETFRAKADLLANQNLGPTAALAADFSRLRVAGCLVGGVAAALRNRLPDVFTSTRVVGGFPLPTTFKERLDSLSSFDDAE